MTELLQVIILAGISWLILVLVPPRHTEYKGIRTLVYWISLYLLIAATLGLVIYYDLDNSLIELVIVLLFGTTDSANIFL